MNDNLMWEFWDKCNYVSDYIRYREYQLIHWLTGQEHWARTRVVAGKRLLSTKTANQLIGEGIRSGEPYWAGRFGGTEMNMIYQQLLYRRHPEKDRRQDALKLLCKTAGFFPYSLELGEKFVDLMLQECSQMDLVAAWGRYMEDYIYLKYQKDAKLTELRHIEPWEMYQYLHSNVKPWSAELKGKRVLVIHPFEESIREQYARNREHIFQNIFDAEDILPEFELITLKAVQTIAEETDDRFENWFEALQWMIDRCHALEFDVAIIGCGAYGFPLAAEIKRMGKVAIHLGGATQILFGIAGRRWENEPFYKKAYNEYWTRPMEQEKIRNVNEIENGCYW